MNQIQIKGIDQTEISVSLEALEISNRIILKAQRCDLVTNPVEQQLAVESLTDIKRMLKDMESCRETVKKPVLEIGRKIDALAKEFCLPLTEEGSRIQKLISSFQELESIKAEKIRREEERLRQIEVDRLMAEQEKLREKANSSNEIAALKAEAKIEALDEKMRDTILESHARQAEAAPARTSGMIVKESWKFEVTDIEALFVACPMAIIKEPNNAVIRSLIAQGKREVPGLRIWKETSTTVRT